MMVNIIDDRPADPGVEQRRSQYKLLCEQLLTVERIQDHELKLKIQIELDALERDMIRRGERSEKALRGMAV
jgi:hypothetical protein